MRNLKPRHTTPHFQSPDAPVSRQRVVRVGPLVRERRLALGAPLQVGGQQLAVGLRQFGGGPEQLGRCRALLSRRWHRAGLAGCGASAAGCPCKCPRLSGGPRQCVTRQRVVPDRTVHPIHSKTKYTYIGDVNAGEIERQPITTELQLKSRRLGWKVKMQADLWEKAAFLPRLPGSLDLSVAKRASTSSTVTSQPHLVLLKLFSWRLSNGKRACIQQAQGPMRSLALWY